MKSFIALAGVLIALGGCARTETTETTTTTQAEREQYRTEAQARLDRIDARIDTLEVRLETADPAEREGIRQEIADLRARRDTTRTAYARLGEATEEAWDETRSAFGSLMDDLEASVERTWARIGGDTTRTD